MFAILIPIKHLGDAKQRLAHLFSPVERAELAQVMMEDVFAAVRGVRAAERVFVATSYEPAMVQAGRHGWTVLRETRQVSESDSVDAASRDCASRGVTALLRLPIDLPLVTAADVEDIFTAARDSGSPCAVLVPSRDRTGTNALLRAHPALFPSHFGPGSFAKHLAEARAAGARVVTLRNPRIEQDVDEPDDLRALLTQDLGGTCTGRWLERSGIADRLLAGAGMRV